VSQAPLGTDDAFALHAAASSYVPSEACERALSQLGAALDGGLVPCLEGPTGIGKTLMLQILATRVADRFRPLYLPFPMLATSELCALALGLLGRRAPGDPESALLAVAADPAARGRPLLLLIDDAASLPEDSARGLAALAMRASGSLRVALAGIDGDALLRSSAAFGDALVRVALQEGIPEASVRDYVSARLDRAHAPDHVRLAFDDTVVAELGRLAAGNPRRLHVAAQKILRRTESPLAIAAPQASPEPPPPAEVQTPAAGSPLEQAERVGEYRFVRGRHAGAATPGGDAAPAAAASSPPLVPPAQVDLTLALLARPAAGAGPAPARAARPAQRPAATPAEPAPRASRSAPPVLVVAGVAALSAVLGFALALQRERAWRVLETLAARIAPPPVATFPAPAPTPIPILPSAPAGAPAPAVASDQPPAPAPEAVQPGAPAAEPASASSPAPAPAAPPSPSAPPETEERIEISINATPWAKIAIDGEEVGETPLAGVKVKPGMRLFRATYPDGRVRQRGIPIDEKHRIVVFE
jgi:hypothetical protein